MRKWMKRMGGMRMIVRSGIKGKKRMRWKNSKGNK